MDKTLLVICFGLLVIRSAYWVFSVWEKGNPGKKVFFGQVGELFLLFLFLTQVTGLAILPMPHTPLILVGGFLLVCLGVGLCFAGKAELGQQWYYAGGDAVSKKLVTTGIYKYLRHPIYTGYILSFVGMELLLGSYLWISFLALFVPFSLQIQKEESRLEKRFAKKYKDYRRQTKNFIPFVW